MLIVLASGFPEFLCSVGNNIMAYSLCCFKNSIREYLRHFLGRCSAEDGKLNQMNLLKKIKIFKKDDKNAEDAKQGQNGQNKICKPNFCLFNLLKLKYSSIGIFDSAGLKCRSYE
ncbi:hypothetical protein DINM_005179 [Dirofilaria immitis]|nr:hypothetical protein [Dirofilaria immitis]